MSRLTILHTHPNRRCFIIGCQRTLAQATIVILTPAHHLAIIHQSTGEVIASRDRNRGVSRWKEDLGGCHPPRICSAIPELPLVIFAPTVAHSIGRDSTSHEGPGRNRNRTSLSGQIYLCWNIAI